MTAALHDVYFIRWAQVGCVPDFGCGWEGDKSGNDTRWEYLGSLMGHAHTCSYTHVHSSSFTLFQAFISDHTLLTLLPCGYCLFTQPV